MTKEKDKEPSSGKMAESTSASGKQESNTEKAPISVKKASRK